MRKLALLLLASLWSFAFAEESVTVNQVEHLLAATKGQSDAKVAAKLSNLKLAERASSLRLSSWQAEFPGKHTREALLVLADASAFLDLPASDLPSTPAPDSATQQQILSRITDYVTTTVPKLPNFSARRGTMHYDDVSMLQRLANEYVLDLLRGVKNPAPPPPISPSAEPQPLQPVLKIASFVTYRDRHEVSDEIMEKNRKSASQGIGLTTWGEFGPILSVVVGDAAASMTWDHWVQGAAGPLAVFRFAVPEKMSHYSAQFGTPNKPELAAYHGEIAVDPATGAILRVTILSQLSPPNENYKSSMAVEYGPTDIGGRSYMCPLRGVALSTIPERTVELPPTTGAEGQVPFGGSGLPRENAVRKFATIPAQTLLNDVSFTEYHVFRAEMHIVP